MLDTSAYSAFMSGEPWVKERLQEADEIVLNPAVVGELLAGFRRGSRERRNRDLLGQFLDSPRVSVAPIDGETAERYAVILDGLRHRGTPVPTNDLWIAATAMQHGLLLLTADRHFARIPQVIAHFPH
jgi:predicted nucleic acid-binding protein